MSFVLVRPETLEAIPVSETASFAGSEEPKVDLCLISDGVDGVHCELMAEPHGVRVRSLSPAGIQVNGLQVHSALLFVNDLLAIGPFDFRVERSGAASDRSLRTLPARLHAPVMLTADEEDACGNADDQTAFACAVKSSRGFAGAVSASSRPTAEIRTDGLWLVRLGTVELGPMGWPEIQAMLARGEVQPGDPVCRDGGNGEADWRPIEEFMHRTESLVRCAERSGDVELLKDVELPEETGSCALIHPPARSGRGAPAEAAPARAAMTRAAGAAESRNTTAAAEGTMAAGIVPAAETSGVPEPQYFIQRPSGDEGPLPRHAVQELIGLGTLSVDTPVRLEWSTRWSSAVELGFAWPDLSFCHELNRDSAGHNCGNHALRPEADAGSDEPAEQVTHQNPVSGTMTGRPSQPGLPVAEDTAADAAVISPAADAPHRTSVTAGRRGSLVWAVLAPLFYTQSLVSSLRSLTWKHLTVLLLVSGAAGFLGQIWYSRQARTALTGTVLLDDVPLGEVIVTFTGMRTGEIAAGIADSRGRFRILTLDGGLPPGAYRITVKPKAGAGTAVPHGEGRQIVPVRYSLLATSDLTIEVLPDQSDCAVHLSRLTGGIGPSAGAARLVPASLPSGSP